MAQSNSLIMFDDVKSALQNNYFVVTDQANDDDSWLEFNSLVYNQLLLVVFQLLLVVF